MSTATSDKALKCCTCHAKTKTNITCGSEKYHFGQWKNSRFYRHKRLAWITATSEVGAIDMDYSTGRIRDVFWLDKWFAVSRSYASVCINILNKWTWNEPAKIFLWLDSKNIKKTLNYHVWKGLIRGLALQTPGSILAKCDLLSQNGRNYYSGSTAFHSLPRPTPGVAKFSMDVLTYSSDSVFQFLCPQQFFMSKHILSMPRASSNFNVSRNSCVNLPKIDAV